LCFDIEKKYKLVKAYTMKHLCLSLAFLASSLLQGQDLPGTATTLPGASTTVDPEPKPVGEPQPGDVPPPPEKVVLDAAAVKEIEDVVKTNVHAMAKRNVNLVLDTIHPESPILASTKDMLTYMFARLQLRYTLQRIEVKEVKLGEAKVEVLQVTQKLSGNAAFRDNRIKLLHTLKRDGQKWKIFSSEALMIEYLKY
jgi:hypothetical protein